MLRSNLVHFNLPQAALTLLLVLILAALIPSRPALARLPYSRKEHKKCYYCHADWKNTPKILTEQGKYYIEHGKSLAGMPAELVPGPPPPPEEQKEKSKGPPFGVIVGMLFFVAIIAMIVVSIIKAPVKETAAAGESPGDEDKPEK